MNVATQPPPYLLRTHTAPAVRSRPPTADHGMPNTASHQSLASSHYSAYSNSSLRSSDSTNLTSTSTLFGTPPPPLPTSSPINGAPIEATDNVLNKRGDKDQSLFQICLSLRSRLQYVPGFQEVLEEDERESVADTDPVERLWQLFTKGYPLVALYNILRPDAPVQVDLNTVAERNRAKVCIIKFLQACKTQLDIKDTELFIINDLADKENTNGFVKVTNVINRILDLMVVSGIMVDESAVNDTEAGKPTGKLTQRQHIIKELVMTERTYVGHLEILYKFKKLVEESALLSGDMMHDIFLNLNALLNFQRKFLVMIEHTYSKNEQDQNWGSLFVVAGDQMAEVYEPYIANQTKCEEIAKGQFDKLQTIQGPPELAQLVESYPILSSFLLKPFQRLSKYPLLLRELFKHGDLDEQQKAEVNAGMEAAMAILGRANAAIDREDRNQAIEDLKMRVDDWKGHRIEGFGDLLLHGTFTVLKSDSGKRDNEREYRIYLFEMILLCCKEVDPSKQKNKLMNRPMVDARGKPKLQLKGRIFMQNVTDNVKLIKPGSYTCQIFWKGDPSIENFIIRFNTEEMLTKFTDMVDKQRRLMKESTRGSNSTNTSTTQFTFLQGHTPMENPYAEKVEDDDEDDQSTSTSRYYSPSEISLPRSESTLSMRSRSGTLEGGQAPNGGRLPPPRFPMPISQPLSLRTHQLPNGTAGSPLGGPQESYFSPNAESPVSARTSSASAPYQFPRQQTPNGWREQEQHNRYTAPAMGRAPSREGPGLRNPQRPSLPASASTSYATATNNRLRSASSPDIQNPIDGTRRRLQGHPPIPDVPVPPFPTHYAYAPNIHRSHTASPSSQMEHQQGGLPARTSSQTPHLLQDGLPHRVMHNYMAGHGRYDHQPRQSSLHQSVASSDQALSPPMGPGTPPPMDDLPTPSQLRVKVHCDSAGSTMTLVVTSNISYQSLKDRIDAKLSRSTNLSLANGSFKLRYLDEDDFVVIQNDEDVQTAIDTWKEQQRDQLLSGTMGEIQLYCQ